MPVDPLTPFSAATRSWFESTFEAPTPAQKEAWRVIASGGNGLVIAPTGSGKTLAAFLWSLDRLASQPAPDPKRRLRTLYVSPLKALAVDIERNLRSPLAGIKGAAQRLGSPPPDVTVSVRTGDTPQDERRRFAQSPSDILITTPESLFLLLTSRARDALRYVETVIIDEVHAVAGTKRGAHLALSLERLDELLDRPAQRIGLSATVRPVEEVARFLGGSLPVTVVFPASDKRFELKVIVPVEDMRMLGEETGEISSGPASGPEERRSIWPHVDSALLELIRAHQSTIVFCNSRRLAERLCGSLNELAGDEVARAHHGSVSREQRMIIEEDLKAGRLPAVVATSSLELGIDMGAVDLVVQVEAPDSVASGLQRFGRAGHQVGAVSRGILFPKYRGDLVECAVVAERIADGSIEAIAFPRNPLDVLAQQIVAMVAMDDWSVDDVERVIKRSAPFFELPRSGLESVLDMLSGRYPSDEFAELRPRLNWDRGTDVLSGRPNAQKLAVTSGGTIPDRGLFGVFIVGEKGGRVGELDEEMVYESRVGDTFVLGASSWTIEDITHDRVLVSPAPGRPGKMPFWHGDALGRAPELGRALGAFIREIDAAPKAERATRLASAGLDEFASSNLIGYLAEQKEATGHLPDDRTIVVERFRDELGDWRVAIHSTLGARVHAPWSQAIEAKISKQLGLEVQCMYTDDGIVVRLPDVEEAPPTDIFVFDPEEIEEIVVDVVAGSALFASRFRECAARALLLPKRRPGQRTPLWQQRQKSAYLLQVASKFGSFPIVLETYRECLQDVFDVPALRDLMADLRSRKVRLVDVDTPVPSPFASSLQFAYVGAFMYEGDVPLAERRAQALSLDRSLLAEIMGRQELRELIDEASLAEVELELQLLTDERKIRDADFLHDALREIGDLTEDEITARAEDVTAVSSFLESLEVTNRALRVRIAGEDRWIAIEDAARFRDGLGTALPMGVPHAYLEPVADPLGDLIGRYARTHGPFRPSDPAARFGLGEAVVTTVLKQLAAQGRVAEGEFRPADSGMEWIDVEVLRRIRRRSLAAFRKDVEPVDAETFARFSMAWQGLGPHGPREAGADSLYRVIEQLQGVPIPASALESIVLPSRLPGYTPAMLDELGAAGEVAWSGAGALGSDDGWIVLATAERASTLLPEPNTEDLSALAARVLDSLRGGGALFFRQISDAVGSTDDSELVLALWELVWAGVATNDTLAPLRALTSRTRSRRVRPTRNRRGPSFPARVGPPAAAGRWSALVERESSPTRRLHAATEQLLERHGIVTRGAVATERVPGGFAAVYGVLKAFEDAGRCRRGYFVDGLGGAQFALPGAVDRMRALDSPSKGHETQVLAATDPANPYGAALAWPAREGHRAGRKAGAVVVLVDGLLVFYVEKGGRTILSYSDDPELFEPAVDALVLAARDGALGRISVEKADGESVHDAPFAEALVSAGFRYTSKGLRLRA
ncbi:MAG: ATP-dependent helicase Lhr and Lhr-like helicase [Actinomycetota bacterium]|jgi:ATP-dependent Lhr-like helicase|nr:ATP-dependent helicase Lhr and Lhr-like helicase [Actinomycetota bacterium]